MNKKITVFHTPNILNFHCKQCGYCCKDWEALLTKEEYESIVRKSTSQSEFEPIEEYLEVINEKDDNKYAKIIIQDDNCPFLNKNNLCALHTCWGASYKPSQCRLFPIFIIKTPRGISLSPSFACSLLSETLDQSLPLKILQGDGNINQEQFKNFSLVYDVKTELFFSPSKKISWDAYHDLEKILLEIIRCSNYSITDILLTINHFLHNLNQLKTNCISFNNVLQSWNHLKNKINLQSLRNQKNLKIQCDIIQTCLINKMLAATSENFRSKVLDIFHQFTTDENKQKIDEDIFRNIHEQYYHYTPEINNILRNYFFNKLFANPVMLECNLILGYRLLILTYSLIRWFTMGLAKLDSKEITKKHLIDSIKLIEKEYFHHLNIIDFYLDQEEAVNYDPSLLSNYLINI